MEKQVSKGGNPFSIRSRVMLAGIFMIALIGVCGGWAVQAKLSGAVIAHGQVAVKARLKEVQHPDGGVVRKILVSNGDTVHQGQELIQLDDTQLHSELAIVRHQINELTGRQARLIATREDAAAIVFPAGFETAPESAPIAEGENRVFSQERNMRTLRRNQLSLQVTQFEEQARALQAQKSSNEAERKLLSDDLGRYGKLEGKGLTSRDKLSEMERDLARLDGTRGEITANIARIEGQISEARLRILELDHQARTEAQKDLREVEARLGELTERAVAARDRLLRTKIRSPIDGVVNELTANTENGVISPGAVVMSIVPTGELQIEAHLPIADIDQVAPGQKVRLRFSAFNQRTTPEVDGEVRVVAASATRDPSTGVPYYLCSIRIAGDVTLPAGRKLIPGMPVEVFFQTGERSAMSYLVKPVVDQVRRSMRED